MLKTNNIQINKIKLKGTKVSVTLENPEVQPEQYTFFKKQLKTYKFYINSEYTLKFEMEYEESSQQLSISVRTFMALSICPNAFSICNQLLLVGIGSGPVYDTSLWHNNLSN